MERIIIVSNRLPLQINLDGDDLHIEPSVGGLATGMKTVHQSSKSLWVGWTGLVEEDIPNKLKKKVVESSKAEGCLPVSLTQQEVDDYYFGFSNKTIWPLFHYFTEYTEYNNEEWEAYVKVNRKFADVILANIQEGDKIWVHDYQLLLLPQMIKEARPDITIGFFLHIPFPSFEVFRILPWRIDLLKGMLGADLIGFHTFDYERHFFSSVRRLIGYEINFNQISLENRIVKADSFPMGIDYDKFYNTAIQQQQRSIKDKSKIQKELDMHILMSPDVKLILSIDRLDYTKGIAKRLKAFETFLQKYPEFLEKATLVMLSVPSRANVEQYQILKSEVDELVGRINGRYSTINWTPVRYFYRAMPFENLIDLYTTSEVALLTPIRDGMNLVAKEYIASKIDKKGVLILSEMAGAAKEMSEALVINPNNFDEVADAIKQALEMPVAEQIERNTILQQRLKRYNVHKWATDFMRSLRSTEKIKANYTSKKITPKIEDKLIDKYKKAKKRIIFLDYDGTLVGFRSKPEAAIPDKEIYNILDALSGDERNELVLISGRDRETFDKWFKGKNYSMIVEHGVWMKGPQNDWQLIEQMNLDWKDSIRPAIEFYVDRTPGTFIEEKNFSMVWHYRNADPELGVIRSNELKDELTSLIANHNLEILEGNKVIEVKNSGINKGRSAVMMMGSTKYNFILAIGDDWTDEYLFEALQDRAETIKVGLKNTKAKYKVESYQNVREFLKKLGEV